MIIQTKLVSKDYYSEDEIVTVEGVFNGTEEEWADCVSHTDQMIEWEMQPEENWNYKDFSFRQI